MGTMPDWYMTIKAARILGVPPWELVCRPLIWTTWAIAADQAEIAAENQRNKRHSGASRPFGRGGF